MKRTGLLTSKTLGKQQWVSLTAVCKALCMLLCFEVQSKRYPTKCSFHRCIYLQGQGYRLVASAHSSSTRTALTCKLGPSLDAEGILSRALLTPQG